MKSPLMKFISVLFIIPVRIYQYMISPLFPNSCRFVPTCSEYTAQAIRKYGPLKGIRLGLRRLSKCRPGGGSGYDPVP